MKSLLAVGFASGLLGAWVLGCGDDRMERGLSPAVEEAAPTSEKDMEMTEAERRKRETEEEQAESAKRFDEEAGAAHSE